MFHIPSVRGRRHSLALATVLALVLSVAYWALSARRTGVPAVALTPSLTTALDLPAHPRQWPGCTSGHEACLDDASGAGLSRQ